MIVRRALAIPGACGTFLFKLGDSTPIVHLPGNFPILVYHAYSQAGTYSLTAQGQGNCKGVVDVSLQVLGPTITSMFPFSVIKAWWHRDYSGAELRQSARANSD
jgi:hypothetical protein